MSGNSTNLSLPYLAPAQAQKHVTVNEALRRLDALVLLTPVSATLTAQPAAPADGAVYILPAGKTGAAWGPMANGALAYWRDGAWEQIIPREGWIAWVQDTDQLQTYNGTAWSQATARTALGLGTAATRNTGTSGAAVPLLNTANTWSAAQTFSTATTTFSSATTFSAAMAVNAAQTINVGTFNPGANDQSALRVTGSFGGGILLYDGTGRCGMWTTGSGANLHFGVGGTSTGFAGAYTFSATGFDPPVDNGRSLGNGSGRWTTVFATTGTINTSDAREKTPVSPLDEALRRAATRIRDGIGTFQWLDAVERKGTDKARVHIGVTAQAVEEAFRAEGLDAGRYALFCEDALTEEVVVPARYSEQGELEEPARTETRPLLDADGKPKTRKGVRSDQLAFLLMGARTSA